MCVPVGYGAFKAALHPVKLQSVAPLTTTKASQLSRKGAVPVHGHDQEAATVNCLP
jgi:hypothetical protein